MAKSPSVTLIERDLSTYSVTTSDTVLAVVGYATKGPIGEPTIVTSFKEFKQKFGTAPVVPFSYLAIAKAFNQGNKIIFTRVAETTGLNAAAKSQRVINNTAAQIDGYTSFTRSTDIPAGTAGYVAGDVYSFSVDNNDVYISSPSTGGWYLDNILTQVNSQLAATRGFQEFVNKSVSASQTLYAFKLAANGTDYFAAGAANADIILSLTPTDKLSDIVTKINATLASGTRSYVTLVPLVAAPDVATGVYDFNIAIGGGAVVNVPVTITSDLTTHATIAPFINNALIAAAVPVRCYYVGSKYVFIHTESGASKAIVLTAGSVTDILAEIEEPASSRVAKDGQAGKAAVYADTASAEVNAYTGRIRINSGITGATSTIDITAPVNGVGLDMFATIGILGGVGDVKDGRAAISSSYTVSRSLTTRKITITSTGSIVAPVLTEVGDDSLSLADLLVDEAPVAGTAAVTAATSDKVVIESIEAGSATSLISVNKLTKVDPLTLASTFTLTVLYDGEAVETFEGLTLGTAGTTFFETVINATPENGGSSWINITTYDTNSNGTIVFPDGTYNVGKANDGSTDVAYGVGFEDIGEYDYKVGTDGVPQIGGEDLFIAALASDGELANDELYNFHILITPDNITEAVQNAAIALANARADFIYIVDPPMGYTYTQVRDWHNAAAGSTRQTAINSSYAAIYWPWLKEYDSDNKRYVWCPPSVFLAEKYMEVDRIYNPWYAPAGDTRGKLIVQDIERSPSFSEREELYGDPNCINPIVKFIDKGVEVYGQKTALRDTKATNRVNVRRMVIYAKKLIKKALDAMTFEPNNPDSWQTATNLINSILEPIRQDNGIEQYRVIIDSSVNTPDVVAQNLMKGIVRIVPTGTIELVEINLNVYRTGTKIS